VKKKALRRRPVVVRAPKTKVFPAVSELLRAIYSVTNPYLLLRVDQERCRTIARAAKKCPSLAALVGELLEEVSRCAQDIGSVAHLRQLKERFAEAFVIATLSEIPGVVLELVKRAKTKTPDVKVIAFGKTFWIEIKSPGIVGGEQAYVEIMRRGMDARIAAETQAARPGAPLGVGISVVRPWFKEGEVYDSGSTAMVIDGLIEKIEGNYKPQQFKNWPTVLLIDLDFHLPIGASTSEALKRVYISDLTETEVSGVLWQAAFGNIGDQLKKHIDFKGLSNVDRAQTNMGILRRHPDIAAIMFHDQGKFYGAAISKSKTVALIDSMKKICQLVVVQRP
jgi:hypothetical protein